MSYILAQLVGSTLAETIIFITSIVQTIGITLAVIISWERNHSVGGCIVHGILGWLYVIYYKIVEKEN